MGVLTKSFALRLAVVAAALVVGPATLAPGTAEAPRPTRAALAGDGATAAQTFGWGVMQWDFAWEFGESLDSPPYRGEDIRVGRWTEYSDGTGRVVKYGGGLEFHSGVIRNRDLDALPDHGTTMLTLRDQAAQRGRWEIRERAERLQSPEADYRFIIELIPDDLTADACKRSITIAEVSPGNGSLKIGASAGDVRWSKTYDSGFPQSGDNYAFGLQITGRRITWFVNGRAIASLGAAAARPSVPMTLRLRLVGDGAKEMDKSQVKLDWVRHYDLTRGKVPPTGATLTQGANRC
ncbi:hypothetical protein [Nocardioides antri]|uniref:Glycosyl hydrolase family protein n=1 Tax=Nocardioides antri TaxID=2607659 RepID=A0A5B1M3H6_9ACTN|nr:hypothetical protein [Nocardioides antri]KAA1427186.1 hypothetical protein F0U47_06685 [Nocardioides antri]